MANFVCFDEDEDENLLNSYNNCTDLLNIDINSAYLTESKLGNFLISGESLSMNLMHINCRSLNKNFKSITNLLSTSNCNFTAIGLSETWLTVTSSDTFSIDGYKFVCKSRIDKIGGGVGLFIDSSCVF